MNDDSDTDAHATSKNDGEGAPPAPRWVKAFGIAAIVVAVMLIVMMASGHGGPHSPLRHFRSHATNGDTSAATRPQRP